MKEIIMFYIVLFVIFFYGFPDDLWALQSHGGGEGFIIHQLAHVLFAVAMIGVVIIIKKIKEFKGREWYYFSLGAFFLAFWNIWAFIGHHLERNVLASSFITSGDGIPSITIDNIVTLMYYIYKMDHIILVPSMIFFLIGLKKISSDKTPK
jgi:hypothetical protein